MKGEVLRDDAAIPFAASSVGTAEMTVRILHGDALEQLRTLADELGLQLERAA